MKKSKSGRMKLVLTKDGYITVTSKEASFEFAKDELIPVFEDGVILKEHTFEEIRERAALTVEDLVTVKEVY